MLKRLYSIVALLCVIHVLGGVGLLGTAFGTGRLDLETIRDVVEVLRGTQLPAEVPVATEDALVDTPRALASSESRIKELMERQEVDRLKNDKARVDLEQQRILLDRAMMRLERERQDHQNLVAGYESKLAAARAQELSQSFTVMVRTIGGMKPKNALQSLMNRSDGEAVRILHELPQRNRNIIMDSCKDIDQRQWRDRIFDKLSRHNRVATGEGTG